MTARGIVAQAFVLVLTLVGMSTVSSTATARGFGLALAGLTLVLLTLGLVVTSRRSLWTILGVVSAAALLAFSPFAAGAAPADGWLWSPHWRSGIDDNDLTAVLAIFIGCVVAFSSLYLSSLVDFAYVIPLMRGLGRAGTGMPCQSSLSDQWLKVTKAWLLHRLAALLGFVAGLILAVTIAASSWVQRFDQVVAAAIAAAATLLAGHYLARARIVIAFNRNPPLWVGDDIELADEATGATRRYYVQDIALEGVKLLALDEDGDFKSERWPSHDRMLDLPEALPLLRRRRPFAACFEAGAGCKKVNPHCPCRQGETPQPLEGAQDPPRRRRRRIGRRKAARERPQA